MCRARRGPLVYMYIHQYFQGILHELTNDTSRRDLRWVQGTGSKGLGQGYMLILARICSREGVCTRTVVCCYFQKFRYGCIVMYFNTSSASMWTTYIAWEAGV